MKSRIAGLVVCFALIASAISGVSHAAPAGDEWVLQATPGNNVAWAGVAYGTPNGQGTFVAVGAAGSIMYSSDGYSWQLASGVPNNSYSAVTWGGPEGAEKFVAVSGDNTGDSHRAIYSSDGVNWSTNVVGVDDERRWSAVTWAGGQFVAVAYAVEFGGTSNRVMLSDDGVTWQPPSVESPLGAWRGVAGGGGKLVAVTNVGSPEQVRAMRSVDGGQTWVTGGAPADGGAWRSVAYGGAESQRFVSVGVYSAVSSNRVMTSEDGATWTVNPAVSEGTWQSVAWGGFGDQARFVAVGSAGTDRIVSSNDGSGSWTAQVAPAERAWTSVTYGGNKFVAVSSNGGSQQVMTSTTKSALTYDGNGANSGSVPEGSGQSFAAGSPQVVASNSGDLVRAGFQFAGWNSRADGRGSAFMPGETFAMPHYPLSLYAQWSSTSSIGPSKPRKLTVSGGPRSSKRTIQWRKPTRSTAGTRYLVQVRLRGTKANLVKRSTSKLSTQISRKGLLAKTFKSRGDMATTFTYVVSGRAVSGTATSVPATTTMRVRSM